MKARKTLSLLYLTMVLWTVPVRAADACDLPVLMHQEKNVATVQRLEDAWSVAFLHGDTEFMRCLLIPEFTEIMRSGDLKYFADEIEMAGKNRGKNLLIPALPRATVLLHDNVAVAYGESILTGADGKSQARRFADSFVWENGRWRAFFSQQTPVERR